MDHVLPVRQAAAGEVKAFVRVSQQFAAVAAPYLPGPFAGYAFVALVEAIGRSTASLFIGVAPPAHHLRVDESL